MLLRAWLGARRHLACRPPHVSACLVYQAGTWRLSRDRRTRVSSGDTCTCSRAHTATPPPAVSEQQLWLWLVPSMTQHLIGLRLGLHVPCL